jgi:hypothetical protein
VAIYFFIQPASNKALPAWESRALNTPCVLADFYDSHDAWHFASAVALLLMCLIFFHLDLNAHYKGKNIGERYKIDYHKVSAIFFFLMPAPLLAYLPLVFCKYLRRF